MGAGVSDPCEMHILPRQERFSSVASVHLLVFNGSLTWGMFVVCIFTSLKKVAMEPSWAVV